jgi:chloride channel 2
MKEDLTFNPARPKQRGNYMITNFVSNYDDLGRASIEQMIKHVDKIDYLEKSESRSLLQRIGMYLNLSNPIEWMFLSFFAIVITIFILLLDKIILLGFDKRRVIASSENNLFNFIFWVVTAVLFFLLATSVGYFISADADGSGIPEMKTVLSGINIYRYFSFNAAVGKVIGLFAILVAGPSVGKVGPYVHISCLICNRLMKINYFSKINKSTSSKNNMLAAAAAAGITLALGTPLGGVLFSIESTASIYIVSNIWKSFFCSVICIFVSKMVQKTQTILLADISATKPISFNSEIILFILEGFIGGIIGAMISTLVAKIVYIRRKSKISFLNNRFRYAVIIALIVSVVTFVLSFLRKTDKEIMTLTFSYDDTKLKSLLSTSPGLNLFVVFGFKLILSILCLTVNCPAGVFGPIFAIGAIYGRCYGHFIKSIFNLSDPSIYSLVGAACVFSGASHTLASALIIFEMTGQTSYLAPLLLATLIANLTAQSLSMNIFDVLLVIKNLPHLPSIKSQTMYTLTSCEIMNKVNYYMELDKLTMINSMSILCKLPKKYSFVIPIVDENGTIRYTVQVKNLYRYVYGEYDKCKLSYNIKNQSNFNEFFGYVRRKFFSVKRSFFNQIKYKFRKLYITIRDKQRLKLNKNFEEESNWRLLQIFKDSKRINKF